jgi:hypothetical protein
MDSRRDKRRHKLSPTKDPPTHPIVKDRKDEEGRKISGGTPLLHPIFTIYFIISSSYGVELGTAWDTI